MTDEKEEMTLPWGIEQKDIKPGSMKKLNKTKLQAFSIGRQKKTKYQRDIEERQAKKRKAEQDAETVYKQFAASFEHEAVLEQDKSQHPKKRERQIEQMMQEMKQESSISSTCRTLLLSNIHPTTTETALKKALGAFGRLESVAMQWPAQGTTSKTASVTFYHPNDAELARREIQTRPIDGQILLVQDAIAASPAKEPKRIQIRMPSADRQRHLIDRLASFVARYGQVFENTILSREALNPAYKFLFNSTSEDAMYYRWKVYCLAMDRSETESFQMSLNGPMILPPQRQTNRPVDMQKYMTGQQIARARDEPTKTRGSSLRSSEYAEMRQLLENLTSERASIREAMGFALDLADCAAEIIDGIIDALTSSDTPLPRKIALFHLTSDILHNSNTQRASAYRKSLQESLPYIVQHLCQVYVGINGRMSARSMKEKVLNVLRAWETWSIFSPTYILGLNATFHMIETPSCEIGQLDEAMLRRKCKQAGIVSTGTLAQVVARLQFTSRFFYQLAKERKASAAENAAEIETVAILLRDSLIEAGVCLPEEQERQEEDSEDLDGKPLEEDLDGEPMDDDDLDGEPMDDGEEDLDGEPMEDDDLDGEPMD